MRIRGRGVRCASVVVVFLIAGCAGDAAGQHEEADADLSGAAGKGRPLARSVGQQVRVQPAGGRAAGPWSVGIRINWNSFRGYTQFCEIYQQWSWRLRPAMRQVHLAGEKTFIDCR